MEFLNNTNIVVGIGFLIFVGILIYVGLPGMITRKLDERAVRIKAELDEARALREEAQSLLAGYERRQKEVKAQAEEIVTAARVEAEKTAEAAKEDIRRSVARRMQTATEQIAAAEQAAVRQIKDRAAAVAAAESGGRPVLEARGASHRSGGDRAFLVPKQCRGACDGRGARAADPRGRQLRLPPRNARSAPELRRARPRDLRPAHGRRRRVGLFKDE